MGGGFKGVVTFYASSHGGSNDVTYVGDFVVNGGNREVTQGSTTVTLSVTGYATFLESRQAIARGDFVEIR